MFVASMATPGLLRAQGAAMPVQALYADAVAKERAVQAAMAAPDAADTVLKAVRTVVGDFEEVVRRYPSSSYCDDALWKAARLSAEAFEAFGEPRDRAAATRLLQALVSQYPASKFARQAPGQLASLAEAADVRPAPLTASRPVVVDPAGSPTAVSTRSQSSDASAAPTGTTGSAAPKASPTPLATIKGIRRSVLPDSVRIIVELDREVPFHDERLSNPARVFVDLPSTRANAALIDQTIRFESDADIVRQVRVGRHPNQTTRIVLDTDGVSSYSVYPLYSPYRLVIDCVRAIHTELPAAARPLLSTVPLTAVATPTPPVVSKAPAPLHGKAVASGWSRTLPAAKPTGAGALAAGAMTAAAPTAAISTTLPSTAVPPHVMPPMPPTGAPSRNLAGGLSIARQLGLGISRIVIDPGHGGYDPGAAGSGLTEAELVLDIALRLEKLLAKVPGIEVVLTRRTDEYVPLQERTAIANRESADLFLSIHANANANRQARGVETYFLNFATNLSAASVAARENAASGQTMAMLPDVVKTIALNNKLDESRDFATFVQRAIVGKLKPANKAVRDLGVKQAPFVVLIGAAMPSVLAEVSFLTNAQEAKLLKGNAYRQRIAEALFDAVRKYQGSLKNVPTIASEQ
jgi:N-acetylmuramoyl-L-alanine amidase